MRGLRVAAQETQSRAGVTAAQLFVLTALAQDDEGEVSLSELAVRTMTDRTSVAAVVERLVDEGLATHARSASDRRRAAVALTARGRSVLRKAPAPPTARIVGALRTLPPSQQRSLAAGLGALVDAMGLHDTRAGLLFEDVARRRARR